MVNPDVRNGKYEVIYAVPKGARTRGKKLEMCIGVFSSDGEPHLLGKRPIQNGYGASKGNGFFCNGDKGVVVYPRHLKTGSRLECGGNFDVVNPENGLLVEYRFLSRGD